MNWGASGGLSAWQGHELNGHQKRAQQLEDRAVRHLVRFDIAEAGSTALRVAGQGVAEWRAQLPEEPVDTAFYVNVLTSLFKKKDIPRSVLEGQDLAQSSGWDVR